MNREFGCGTYGVYVAELFIGDELNALIIQWDGGRNWQIQKYTGRADGPDWANYWWSVIETI